MTIDEILACEIPESDYKVFLEFMREHIRIDLPINGFSKSWRASFEALLQVALHKDHFQTYYDEGRKDTIDKVLGVVEIMARVHVGLKLKYHTPTLQGVKDNIEALKGAE